MNRIYVGMDVSKDNFKATIVDRNNRLLSKCLTCGYDRPGLDKFFAKVMRIRDENDAEVVFGLESTGIYHLPLLEYLSESGAQVRVFNGLELRGYKNRVRKLKTDRTDSECIAEALILCQDDQFHIPASQATVQIRELNRVRFRVMDKATECKVQVVRDLDVLCPGYSGCFKEILCGSSINVLNLAFRKTRFLEASVSDLKKCMLSMPDSRAQEKAVRLHTLFKGCVVSSEIRDIYLLELRMLLEEYKLLQEQISRLDSRISKLMSSMDSHLCSIPGIGEHTASVILGELGDIDRFESAEKVVAFAGLDPSISESGRSRKTGNISKRGSRHLRAALYRASLSAIRTNPVCKIFYERLRGRGKPFRLCLTAVSRKLLHIIFSVEKNKRDFYVPDYIQMEMELTKTPTAKVI